MNDSKISILVCNWFDTISPESAASGDYASIDNEFKAQIYSINELAAAVQDFITIYRNEFWDCSAGGYKVNDVLYAADPEIDYNTGFEDRNCLSLCVRHDEALAPDLYHETINELQTLLDKKLGDAN
jgi:hypothetical protein